MVTSHFGNRVGTHSLFVKMYRKMSGIQVVKDSRSCLQESIVHTLQKIILYPWMIEKMFDLTSMLVNCTHAIHQNLTYEQAYDIPLSHCLAVKNNERMQAEEMKGKI